MNSWFRWISHLLAIVILCSLANAHASGPQQPSTENEAAAARHGESQEDISGMYSFLREGEFVQINIQGGSIVTGFISRYGDTDADKGSFLDQFFSKAAFAEDRLTFTTKPVHSIWFEFDGKVQRGPGKTPNEDAYRVIRGKLTQYFKDSLQKVSAKEQTVEFKSFPQDYADTEPAPAK